MDNLISNIKNQLKEISKDVYAILNKPDPVNIIISVDNENEKEFIIDFALDNTTNMNNYGYVLVVSINKIQPKKSRYLCEVEIYLGEASGSILHEKTININSNPKDYEKDINKISKVMLEFKDDLKQLVILNNNNLDWYLTRE